VELDEKSNFPVALLIGVGVMALLLGGLFFLTRESPQPVQPVVERLPMGAVEQEYSAQIQFTDLKMSRAANFLDQEVTFLFGTAKNGGQRRVREIELTIEFHNLLNQVVLRETRRLVGRRAAPLEPGEEREFQLTFEHVPADWNRHNPALRITGLVLE